MSLATRCSACGTVFRVVQDQLKVSEGWVRCGRCNEVFNALEGLFDLDRESPPEWQPQDQDDSGREAPARRAASDEPDPDEWQEAQSSDPRLVDKIDSELFGERRVSGGAAHDADDESTWPGQPAVDDDAARTRAATTEGFAADRDNPVAPEFVRRAERVERWNRPWVRAVLGALALVLLGLLVVQVGVHFRDDVAARYPDVAPVLSAWCEAAGCRIGPPRHIDAVAVESTALSRTGGADAYRLSISLRNHGTAVVAVPAIDLALTDASGQLIARRAFDARDFAGAPDHLAAGADLSLQTVLTAGATKITGYTVELFYP